MTEKMPDRRVQRTRRLLHEALMSHVIEKKYESVTVQEILDRANLGRSTFYTHFRDKDELLVSGFQHFRRLLKSAHVASGGPPGKSYERIIGFSMAAFQHAGKYRSVILALLGSNAETIVRRELHSVLKDVVRREIEVEVQKREGGRCPVSPELLTHFLVSTYISVLLWWLTSKNPPPARDIDMTYRHLVLPCLESMFG